VVHAGLVDIRNHKT